MGACFSLENRLNHEFLDEYDEEEIIHIQNECSVNPKKTRWWRRRQTNGHYSKPRQTIKEADKSPWSFPEDYWNIFESEPSMIIHDAFDDISYSCQSQSDPPSSIYTASTKSSSSQQIPRSKVELDHINQSYQKHKGRALRIRLANHRRRQIAQIAQYTPQGSPTTHLTQDMPFFTQTERGSLLDNEAQHFTNSSPKEPTSATTQKKTIQNEKLSHWDDDELSGTVWKRIRNKENITAVATNFPKNLPSSSPEPLLLAMGDKVGSVIVTEIEEEESRGGVKDLGDASSQNSNTVRTSNMVQFSTEGVVRSLKFGTSTQLIVGGDDCFAWVLSIVVDNKSRNLKEIVLVHKFERIDRVYSVSLSPDQKFLAVGGFDGKVALFPMTMVWNRKYPECQRNHVGLSAGQLMKDCIMEIDRPGLIYCLDWSPASEFLAVAGSDKVCGIYNAPTFDLIHETSTRSSAIQDLRWSYDGKYLALGDREVAIVEGKPPFKIKHIVSHPPQDTPISKFRYRITSLCWSPSNRYLAIGGSDGHCLVVETAGWALVFDHHRTESIHSLAWGQRIDPMKEEFRRYLVVSANDFAVAVIKAGTEGNSLNTDHYSSIGSRSYFTQSTESSDWVLRDNEFQDLEDISHDMPSGLKSKATIITIAFSNVGKARKISSYMAYAADDCSLTIVTTRDWKAVFQVEFSKPIRSIAFSKSNTYLALGGDEGILNVLSVKSRTMILNSILSSPIKSIAFSMNDMRLGVGLEDGVLALFDPDSNWEPVGDIDQIESSISCQDWTLKTFACGRLNGLVTVFNVEDVLQNFFEPIAEWNSNHPIRTVSFGKNGSLLSVAGDDGAVSILDARDGWVLCHKIELGHRIFSTRWSSNGRYITFVGRGKTFHIHDTRTWGKVKEVDKILPSLFSEEKDEMSISCIAWSRDDTWIAIGGYGVHLLNTENWKFVEPFADMCTSTTSLIADKK